MYELLEEAGLTQREIKVYTALLEIGESTAGSIIKESGIPGSKIYETLDKLKERGLVSSIVKKNILHFTASPPKQILHLLDSQREKIATSIVPQLELLEKKDKRPRETTMYEGVKGVKAIYALMLRATNRGDTIYALGIPLKAQEMMAPFLTSFNRKRTKKCINLKAIYHRDCKKFGEQRKKLKYTQVRYMPTGLVTPAWVDVFADYVVLFDITDTPTAVLIRDKNMAQSFRAYFEMIWKQSK